MTREEAITQLRGRVRALLTAADQRGLKKQPLEVFPNSRIYKELREALYLVECPQAVRDMKQKQQERSGA